MSQCCQIVLTYSSGDLGETIVAQVEHKQACSPEQVLWDLQLSVMTAKAATTERSHIPPHPAHLLVHFLTLEISLWLKSYQLREEGRTDNVHYIQYKM